MRSYIRTSGRPVQAQWLALHLPQGKYYPCLHHATIDQNRPYGDQKTFREHAHPVYHLVLYTANQGGYRVNGKKFQAGPGSLAIISPGQSHDFVTDRADTIYSEVTFTYETDQGIFLDLAIEQLILELFGINTNLAGPVQLNAQQTRQLKSVLIEIVDFADQASPLSHFYEQRALMTVFELLITIGNVETATPTEHDALIKAREAIRQNFHLPLDIDRLADNCGISRGYLFRIFKREYQMTPLEYQQQLRIEAARTLLRTTSLRCNEVATRVGYENSYYFHRVFKNRTGMTPRDFRMTSQSIKQE